MDTPTQKEEGLIYSHSLFRTLRDRALKQMILLISFDFSTFNIIQLYCPAKMRRLPGSSSLWLMPSIDESGMLAPAEEAESVLLLSQK